MGRQQEGKSVFCPVYLITFLQQVFQKLGATYTEAVEFPKEVSECGNITLVNGTVRDSLIKSHNGSMIVSVEFTVSSAE